eukprot:scaffold542_cov154-Skeletonema_menzelii.AAC.15
MADARGDDEIFVYVGGDQRVPMGVRRARIHQDVKIIPGGAFYGRTNLIYVEFHDGIESIGVSAFDGCWSLRSVKLLGVKIVRAQAFSSCRGLTDVEFGNELETIENHAFYYCESLRNIVIPSARTIGKLAFYYCHQLTELELPEGLESIEEGAFRDCPRLRRIAMPLKVDVIGDGVFHYCSKLTTVNLDGGIHNTVASLHLESWRNEMTDEINRINQVLPNTDTFSRTLGVQQWIRTVISRLDHYKAEHRALLKEATTLLELALWKANLDDNKDKGGVLEKEGVRTTRGRRKRARKEISIASGASIVIKNVLPFLELK